jgi:hypothetical protein
MVLFAFVWLTTSNVLYLKFHHISTMLDSYNILNILELNMNMILVLVMFLFF